MSAKYKTSYKAYPAWDYQEEIANLNQASEKGWQLIKGGCFHSKFVKNPDICYRYQMDFRKVDDMGRYIETFREQGWEYINSTFNGWHIFRKFYDPTLPEEAYEIFTDRESLHEMKNRLARIMLILGTICVIFAAVCLVRMILKPHLPALIQLLLFAIEGAVLLRGRTILRAQELNRKHKGGRALFAAFLCTIVIGCTASIALTDMRPYISSQQNAEKLTEPITDNRWGDFDIKYTDNYYLDLDIDADVPITFEIVDANGEIMYSEKGTDVHKENIRIKLPKGQYWFSMTAEAEFELSVSID